MVGISGGQDADVVVAGFDQTRLSDSVFNYLYESIISGRIGYGEWLRQETIARELAVSQVTVREALNRLVMEGLAEQIPRKGVRAIEIRHDDVRDLYEIRLECECRAWIAAIPLIQPETLERMRSLIDSSVVTSDAASVEHASAINREFHMIPVLASGRRYLIKTIVEVMGINNHHALMTKKPSSVRIRDGAVNRAEHIALVDALGAGDAVAVDRLIRSHITRAMEERLALFGSR